MDAGDLPSGMVTFVFADIEGSTRVMRRLGDDYPARLERHRDLLRAAWGPAGGSIVSTEGDGTFAAFPSANNAISACVAAQRMLQAEPWPADAPIRVRMGVHCGLAAPRHGDYAAVAVSQAARVIKAAHGGQVLVSDAAAARSGPVPGVDLVPLGMFRLRDFDEAVRLFQASAPGTEHDFPPPRALPAEGHNLVVPANSFIDRDAEAAWLMTHPAPGRLVTIVGPGGIGKTRLSTEVGLRLASVWTDGVWAIDLATVDDAALVADAVGVAVGAPSQGGSRREEVIDYLRDRKALIVFDNTEVHIDAVAGIAPVLLRSCPSVGVLATSREPLRVPGEELLPLSPLGVPPEASREEPKLWPAVRLFIDRALSARPGLELDDATTRAIVGICRRLEGLPLGIEIAAARMNVLQAPEILAGLDDMFALLKSNDRSLAPRQRTMQSLLDWSYRLLDSGEQAALRRLAVFGESFSIDGARAAAAGDGVDAEIVPDLVWSLAEKSLITVDLQANATRYRFLETVRQYGRRLLAAAGEQAATAGQLASWYLDRLGPSRPADRAWIGDVSFELDNLRALVPIVSESDQQVAQQLACLVGRYTDATQAFIAGIESLEKWAGELKAEAPSRVSLLTTLAHLHLRIGATERAAQVLDQAAALRSSAGVPSWDDVGYARTLGELHTRQGDHAAAATIAEAALQSDLSDRGRARMWNLIGLARSALGDLPGALAAFEAELRAHEAAGHEAFLPGAEGNLAEIAFRLGDSRAAAVHQRACMDLAIASGQPVLVAYSFLLAARIAAARSDWGPAVVLMAKGAALLEETGQRLYADDLAMHEELVARVEEELGAEAFRSSWERGRAEETLAVAGVAGGVFAAAAG